MKSENRKSSILRWGLSLFIIAGVFMVWNSSSLPSITWMHIYGTSDFAHISLLELFNFYKELRIPIPPIIGLAEILSIRFTGSARLVTEYAYRASLIASYCAAIILAHTSVKRLLLSFLTSFIFLYATVIIHPGNPQNYDIFFPLFFLTYVILLKKTTDSLNSKWSPFLSGFFLSMTELARPFVVYMMPLFIISAYYAFKKDGSKKQFFIFIVPIILISGIWHGYLFSAHRQISFSNNAGFNLSRAWPQIAPVDLVKETHNKPLSKGRWPNLNTEEHAENSNRLQTAVLKYWLSNPTTSFLYVISCINDFLSARTGFYAYKPESSLFGTYKLLVKITSSLVLVNVGALTVYMLKAIPRIHLNALLTKPDNLILIFTLYCIVVLSIGETGEKARLLISILPFLATLPVFRAPASNSDVSAIYPKERHS